MSGYGNPGNYNQQRNYPPRQQNTSNSPSQGNSSNQTYGGNQLPEGNYPLYQQNTSNNPSQGSYPIQGSGNNQTFQHAQGNPQYSGLLPGQSVTYHQPQDTNSNWVPMEGEGEESAAGPSTPAPPQVPYWKPFYDINENPWHYTHTGHGGKAYDRRRKNLGPGDQYITVVEQDEGQRIFPYSEFLKEQAKPPRKR